MNTRTYTMRTLTVTQEVDGPDLAPDTTLALVRRFTEAAEAGEHETITVFGQGDLWRVVAAWLDHGRLSVRVEGPLTEDDES